MSYLDVNKKAYECTAEEFGSKIPVRINETKQAVDVFSKYAGKIAGKSVLELGPGSGFALSLLTENGYNVTAIEFSEKMAEVAKKNAPRAKIICDEFLSHDFKDEKYDGIFGLAFIHLFPKEDTKKILNKIYNLLNSGGVVFISTTKHDKSEEGYFEKTNFNNLALRYRRRFTFEELSLLLNSVGFKLVYQYDVESKEVAGKIWMNFILKR